MSWTASGSTGGFFLPTSAQTDASGIAKTAFNTPPLVGTFTISATDNLALKGTAPPVTSIAGPPASYVVTSSSSNPIAGAAVTITAKLVDLNGNAVALAGRTVTWSKTGAGGSFSAATSTTDAAGIATVSFTTAASVTQYAVTATDNASITGTTSSISTSAGPPSASTSTVTAAQSSLPANGTRKTTITVRLKDANGNNVATSTGIAVALSTTGGTLSAVTNNGNGTYTAALTAPSAAGSATVSATLDGTPIANSATVTFVVGAAARYLVTSSPASPTIETTITISAQLADADSALVQTAGRTVTWSKTGSGGSFSAPTSTTNASGIATISFTMGPVVGDYTFTATDDAAAAGTSGTVRSAPAAAAKYTVAATAAPVAGGPVTIAAQIADNNGNAVAVSGKVVTWSSTGGGTFGAATSTTNASGIATVAFTTDPVVGANYTISVTDNEARTGTSPTITTVEGPPASIRLTSSRVVSLDSAQTSPMTFETKNQYGVVISTSGLNYTSRSAAATVSPSGVITGGRRGQTFVVATVASSGNPGDSVLVAVASAGGVIVRTDLTRFDLKTDTTFTVAVIVDMRSSGEKLGAATIQLTWDPTLLSYVSEAEGAANAGATVNATQAPSGSFTLAMASSAGFAGTIELRKITFKAASVVRSGPLTLLASELSAATTFTDLLPKSVAVRHPLVTR